MKLKLAKLKEEELEFRRGLGIFKIDHPLSKDIQNLEKDISETPLNLILNFKGGHCYIFSNF